ncbi:MAG: DUF362 domain-containing protein, partial [Candidatus Micrarchaeota archaeon]
KRGYAEIDLGRESEFSELGEYARFFRWPGPIDQSVLAKMHSKKKNVYSIPRTILEADFVLSVPKLKTHAKSGVTLNLKNMIGLTNRKEWLPHHREGAPPSGDEAPCFPLRRKLKLILKCAGFSTIGRLPHGLKLLRAGALSLHALEKTLGLGDKMYVLEGRWTGNDTIWRAIVDLNRILFYAYENGMHTTRQRAYFSIVDGVVGGEGEGPLMPKPKRAGVIACGEDPVAVDYICARIMGIDGKKIKAIARAGARSAYPIGTCEINRIETVSNRPKARDVNLAFELPANWRGFIELEKTTAPKS